MRDNLKHEYFQISSLLNCNFKKEKTIALPSSRNKNLKISLNKPETFVKNFSM